MTGLSLVFSTVPGPEGPKPPEASLLDGKGGPRRWHERPDWRCARKDDCSIVITTYGFNP
jgi:hypothetical protein